jgi:hypothetical protein
LVTIFVLRETVDINENDWGKTEYNVEGSQHIEERSDTLGIAEGDTVAAHESRIEEFMHLER